MGILKDIKAAILLRRAVKELNKSIKIKDMLPAMLLIQFPTRERPDKFLLVAKKYIDLLEDKENWIMNVSCDEDDFTMNNPKMIDKVYSLAPEGHIYLNFNANKSKIQAVNADVDSFTFDILLLASDDMIPKEPNYDKTIRDYYKRFYPDYDGVLHFNDGYQRDQLNTLCIIGRVYYLRFGYIYHPSYLSLYADDEFDLVSKHLGKKKYFDQVIIKHEHPNFGFVPNDQLYLKNGKLDAVDRKTFRDRKSMNFGL
jgi:hypothetical protein